MNPDFSRKSYEYILPQHQIAQVPAEKREQSRLLVLDCSNNDIDDLKFTDIYKFFESGDLLIVNDTKVFPARLEGYKETGGRIELFLLEYPDFNKASAAGNLTSKKEARKIVSVPATGLLKSSKKTKPGVRLFFTPGLEASLLEHLGDGKVKVELDFDLNYGSSPEEILLGSGRIPLPPYIQRTERDHPDDRERYQTLFAKKPGAVAAPTAGLHFSESLLQKLAAKKIQIASITLHVGYGTFAPVRVEDIRFHKIHEEYVEINNDTARLINQTLAAGKKIWPVGTTTVRALEYAADDQGLVQAVKGWCDLYVYPGYRFKIVKNLITNFHLPGSSLLFLVAALTGRTRILQAYVKAIELGYRFYSYGDAMLIIC